MAKKSAIQTNLNRAHKVQKDANKRAALKATIMDKTLPMGERFKAQNKLSKMDRNGSKVRLRNRDNIDGRPRGVFREYQISRINFRILASEGKLPGVTKSSW